MKYLLLDPEKIIATTEFEFITNFLESTRRTQIGWHYVVDLAWIYSQAQNWPRNYRILDAGGGLGPTQFLLVELGFNVTNIDLFLDYPTLRFQQRYNLEIKRMKSYQETMYVTHLAHNRTHQDFKKKLKSYLNNNKFYQHILSGKYRKSHDQWRLKNQIKNDVGQLEWIQANLSNIPEISTNSFDAVVSLSALEHIPKEQLPQAWDEIKRICKPEAKFAITTSATEQEETWFHNPSKGYCFSEQDLKTIFNALPEDTNLSTDEMIEKYLSCKYLKDNLAKFYSRSGNNGMPWGEWNPQYVPVGLFQHDTQD